jgi:hypothetical protein
MGKEEIKDLKQFLKPFPDNVKDITLWLHEFVWDLYPDSNELIYDNYNALAIGFSLTDKAGDVFCSIAVYSKHVNFGFNRGSEIADPESLLKGEGSLYRYLTIREKSDLPKVYIKELLKEAHTNAVSKVKQKAPELKGKTITKSVSVKQRRPK